MLMDSECEWVKYIPLHLCDYKILIKCVDWRRQWPKWNVNTEQKDEIRVAKPRWLWVQWWFRIRGYGFKSHPRKFSIATSKISYISSQETIFKLTSICERYWILFKKNANTFKLQRIITNALRYKSDPLGDSAILSKHSFSFDTYELLNENPNFIPTSKR